jgi:hypothetical protein
MLPQHLLPIVMGLAARLLSVAAATTTTIAKSQNCTALALTMANSTLYSPETLELVVQFANSEALADCFLKVGRDTEHVLELVFLTGGPDAFDENNCCRTLCKGSRVQDQVYVSTILTEGSHSFKYVQGTYIVRHRKCSCSKGYCFRCQTKWCSAAKSYGEESPVESCGDGDKLSTLFQSSRFPIPTNQNQTVQNCTIDVTAVYRACSVILHYSEIEIAIYQVHTAPYCTVM